MQIKLKKPFTHEDKRIEVIEVPEYIQVGHRKAYAKFKDLPEEDAGIAMCAAICGLPEEMFDRISLQDFEEITAAVQKIFAESDGKKPRGQKKN